MKYMKIHRRYPHTGWDFRAISARVGEKDIIYGVIKNKERISKGIEIYQGTNYIVGSSGRSYSRRYNLNKVPSRYKSIVEKLKDRHNATRFSRSDINKKIAKRDLDKNKKVINIEVPASKTQYYTQRYSSGYVKKRIEEYDESEQQQAEESFRETFKENDSDES